MPDYWFRADHEGTANAAFPNATSFQLIDTRHYSDWVPDPSERSSVRFGAYRFYDEQGEHLEVNYNFSANSCTDMPKLSLLPIITVDFTRITTSSS